MPLNRLPVAGSRTRTARVDPNATRGAVVGVNLLNADGSVFDLEAAVAAAVAKVTGSGDGVALEDVQARADAPITVAGSPGEGAFTYGWAGTTTDVPEPDTDPTNLYFTDARFYADLKTQLVAGDNISLAADDDAKTLTIASLNAGLNNLITDAGDAFVTEDGADLLVE